MLARGHAAGGLAMAQVGDEGPVVAPDLLGGAGDGGDTLGRGAAEADGAVVDLVALEAARRPSSAAFDRSRPAMLGGPAVRSELLAVGRPSLGQEEEAEVLATMRSGWLTNGPRARRFEDALSGLTGAGHVVAVNSCTAALHVALAALGIGSGDEVIVPAITWPSTANVVIHLGARPVLVDVDPTTLCLDAGALPAARSPRTKAVVPVHIAGQPVELDNVWEFAERYGIAVVEDAAHAVGASYHGRPIGASERSAATCFSFYPTKNLTTGEGGAVLTADSALAARVRLLANNGVTRDAWGRHGPEAGRHWEAVLPGYKAAMSDLQAAIGLHQVPRLAGFLARRSAVADRYALAFCDLPGLEPLRRVPNVRHAWHLYVVLLRLDELAVDRDTFTTALRAEGIATGIHFRSLHVQPWFRDALHLDPGDLPRAAEVTERMLSLPLFPGMSDADVEDVIQAVTKVVHYYSRSVANQPVEARV